MRSTRASVRATAKTPSCTIQSAAANRMLHKNSQPKFCDVRPEINCFNKETLFKCDCERWSSTSTSTTARLLAIGETELDAAAAHNTSWHLCFILYFSAIFFHLLVAVAVASVVAWSKINYLYMLLTRARFVHTRKMLRCDFRIDL